jgi:hypothetical protein
MMSRSARVESVSEYTDRIQYAVLCSERQIKVSLHRNYYQLGINNNKKQINLLLGYFITITKLYI